MQKIIIISIYFLVIHCYALQAQDKIEGYWQTENKEAIVQIYKTNNLISGKIISVSNSNDSAKVGLVVLKNFIPNGNIFEKGTIIEPRHNHKTTGQLMLNGNILKVSGKALFGLISKTETWVKIKYNGNK